MRWIILVMFVAAVLVMGGAEMNDAPITFERFLVVVGFLAMAAVIANWPKRRNKLISGARRVRPRT